jgi:hypothetical protein
MKTEFDSAYPVHLNGIISQDEYQTSINRINGTKILADKSFTIRIIVSTVILTGGFTLCSLSPIGLVASINVFLALLGVGLAATILGLILLCIGIRIGYRRTAHLRQVIAEESMKYSSRSPISCSWRLETGVFGGHGGALTNRVSIVLFYQYL